MSQVNEKPSLDTAPAGSIRFNTDSAKLEIYNGEQWWEIDATSPDQQTGGTRAVMGGGKLTHPARQDVIQFVTMDTTGNAVDFGDLSAVTDSTCAVTSPTICVWTRVGTATPEVDTEFSQFGSLGNSIDFGDLATGLGFSAGGTGSNSVKGIVGGGDTPSLTNVIQSCVIATRGNFTDFGDLTVAREDLAGCSNGHGGIDLFEPRAPELYSPTGTVLPRGGAVGDICIVGGGESPSPDRTLESIQISTTGNSTSFGNLITTPIHDLYGATASASRLLFLGGSGPSNVIQYIEFASKGNAADFGNLTDSVRNTAGHGNDTRGLSAGGSNPSIVNVIDYVTYATVGNATDFGDLSGTRTLMMASGSNTRTLFGGGAAPSAVNTIEYVTTASTSNVTDFGDLTVARYGGASSSSTTRSVFGGGNDGSASNVIDYVTIASTGDATDFGNLTVAREAIGARGSNQTRAIFSGGYASSSDSNVIDYVTIASTGDATDFGDLVNGRRGSAGYSNGHGGLS